MNIILTYHMHVFYYINLSLLDIGFILLTSSPLHKNMIMWINPFTQPCLFPWDAFWDMKLIVYKLCFSHSYWWIQSSLDFPCSGFMLWPALPFGSCCACFYRNILTLWLEKTMTDPLLLDFLWVRLLFLLLSTHLEIDSVDFSVRTVSHLCS